MCLLDDGEWLKTAEHFMMKWIAAEKVRARLQHASLVCPNVTGRIKEMIAQSKRVRASSLVIID